MNKPYSPLPDTLTDATHLTDVQGGGHAAEAERAKSNVASESKSRRNYWPLVIFSFFCMFSTTTTSHTPP